MDFTPSRARRLEAGERWARLAQPRAASRPGRHLPFGTLSLSLSWSLLTLAQPLADFFG